MLIQGEGAYSRENLPKIKVIMAFLILKTIKNILFYNKTSGLMWSPESKIGYQCNNSQIRLVLSKDPLITSPGVITNCTFTFAAMIGFSSGRMTLKTYFSDKSCLSKNVFKKLSIF